MRGEGRRYLYVMFLKDIIEKEHLEEIKKTFEEN
jgi:hypothetical protein